MRCAAPGLVIPSLVVGDEMESYSHSSLSVTQPAFSEQGLEPLNDIEACIENVKVYIEGHLHEPLSLSNLAQSGGFSVYYFARRFKQYTGLSPKQYVLRKRLEHAYKLLRQGCTTVSEVAYQTGFTDQSHLVRYFKKCWGLTPKEVLDAESNSQLLADNIDMTHSREYGSNTLIDLSVRKIELPLFSSSLHVCLNHLS
jgi:AraC-like DNA-binding protein